MHIARLHAEVLVGLHEDAIRPVIEIEVVDVLRAHKNTQGIRDLRKRDAHCLRLLTVDRDKFLRIVGGESGDEARDVFARPAGSDNLVRNAIEIGECVAAGILEHELETAVAANAADGWRLNDRDQAPTGSKHERAQLGRKIGHNIGR